MFAAFEVNLPQALVHYTGSWQVRIMDGKSMSCMSALNPCVISIPACEVQPLLIFSALDASGSPWGPDYAWDYERSDWMTYDEKWHKVPSIESSPVVEEVAVVEPVEEVEEVNAPEPASEEMVDEDDDLSPSEDDDEYDWS